MSTTTYAPTDEIRDESIFETSAHAISDAAVDARASAKAAAQSVKDGVGRGAYKAAFGVSFGVVFTGVFLTELLPVQSSLRRGLEDGAGAALDAIDARRHPVRGHLDEELPLEPEHVAPIHPTPAARAPRKRTRVESV